jgi:hypothetical protein
MQTEKKDKYEKKKNLLMSNKKTIVWNADPKVCDNVVKKHLKDYMQQSIIGTEFRSLKKVSQKQHTLSAVEKTP